MGINMISYDLIVVNGDNGLPPGKRLHNYGKVTNF